jgi:hypothetical protein
MRKKLPGTQRLASSITQFAADADVGKDKIYEAIRGGHLIARKMGSRTIILYEDGLAYLRSLPKLDLSKSPG